MKPPSKKVIPAPPGFSKGKSSLASKTNLSRANVFVNNKTLKGFDLPATLSSTERAARLKLRFADTILKANPHKKLNLEGMEREEKLKIKVPIQEEQLKSKRLQVENDRKAAKEALEKLERTVDVEDNFKVMRDFDKLINAPPQDFY